MYIDSLSLSHTHTQTHQRTRAPLARPPALTRTLTRILDVTGNKVRVLETLARSCALAVR